MKKLYYKKWFARKNWGSHDNDMESYKVESETFFAGSTEKAVKFFTAMPSGYGSQVRIITRFVPKSALIFCEEDPALFEDLNKKEMASAALDTINDFLSCANVYSFQEALKFGQRQFDMVL